jgi:hypothetical protein
VRAWSVRGGAVEPSTMHVLTDHHTAVTALEIDATGTALYSVGRDHRVIVTPLTGGRPLAADAAPSAPPWVAVRGADPRYIVGRADGTILVRPAKARSFAELRAALDHRH